MFKHCFIRIRCTLLPHYSDVIMSTIASRITGITIVYSTVYSGADQRKHQSSASLAFLRGIHRWPMNSPQKGPVTRKIFLLDDVIVTHENTVHHPIHILSTKAIAKTIILLRIICFPNLSIIESIYIYIMKTSYKCFIYYHNNLYNRN